MELLADANDLGCYDDGKFHERSEVVGGEQRQERRRGTTTVRLFIAGRSSSGFDSTRRIKVAQLFKLYNFASRNIFKFYLHFEI